MKIRVEDIPEDGLSLDLTEQPETLKEPAGGLDFEILSPVQAHMDVSTTEGNVLVQGNLATRLGLECSRCLKDFEQELSTRFVLFFVVGTEEGKGKEVELKTADMDVNYLAEPELDTTDLLLAQIAIDKPLYPVCDTGCKGLCPQCGADLNQGECGCTREERVDPRLAKLKDFKVK